MNVRTDGLAAVLGPLADDPHVRVATLVDVDSGMVLDACGPDAADDGAETESRGAAHAELVRTATGLAAGARACEVVVTDADGRTHVLQPVADPHGGRLALTVVVDGSPWMLSRIRRRLRAVSESALTAGPSTALRPTAGGWEPNRLQPPAPRAPDPQADARQAPAQPADVRVTAGELLWVPPRADDRPGPTVPALVGIPLRQSSDPEPHRRSGSAWTAPPAPSTPLDVHRATPVEQPAPASPTVAAAAQEPGTPESTAPVPAQRRPAPPSALPPGSSRSAPSPAPRAAPAPEDRAGHVRTPHA